MENSWISFLLPNDEYKRNRLVYFLAESSVVLAICLILSFCVNNLFPKLNFDTDFILIINIGIFIIYLLLRYICSGIEYTNVSTRQEFALQRRNIIVKSITFVIVFFVFYLAVIGIPRVQFSWLEIILTPLIATFFFFLINYFSLKRSYKKNKQLLDSNE
ncbi:DUF3278 domain-containing protein [Priestia endophytica]|uniref:DUF3278 domain-containing protein n=1 Tax=Priestia endophytica TaxID=135735 RepID=UPI0022821F8F|nr:DUF3278 domain-containing protein [Priestia endophytica]MCY8235539.1 DUF3278 domain-containing protein [Priestia endophytica]